MDPISRMLIQLSMWVRNPPSPGRAALILAVVALCLGLVAVERWVGWPDWAQVERVPIIRH